MLYKEKKLRLCSDGSGSKKSGFERARVVQIPAGYINSGIPGTRRVIEEKKVPKF